MNWYKAWSRTTNALSLNGTLHHKLSTYFSNHQVYFSFKFSSVPFLIGFLHKSFRHLNRTYTLFFPAQTKETPEIYLKGHLVVITRLCASVFRKILLNMLNYTRNFSVFVSSLDYFMHFYHTPPLALHVSFLLQVYFSKSTKFLTLICSPLSIKLSKANCLLRLIAREGSSFVNSFSD